MFGKVHGADFSFTGLLVLAWVRGCFFLAVFHYSSAHKYVLFESLAVTVSVSRRMISFRSESCLSKLERVKANSIEVVKIVENNTLPQHDLNN